MKLSALLDLIRRSSHEVSHCDAFGHAMRFNAARGRWECGMCPAWCWPRDTGAKEVRAKLPGG